MQNPDAAKAVVGVVYNTSMSRPDAALALCALYGFEGLREAHLESVCVAGAGLGSAVFCDIVGHIYLIGAPRNSNSVLPVGLSAADPLPQDAAMLRPPLERKNEKGEPQYERTVQRVSDTAMAEAALRNAVTFNADSAVILSAPATTLARSLDLPGVSEVYKARVKRLIVVDSGAFRQDAAALRRIFAEWPAPIFLCGREVGEAFPFPASAIEAGFSWSPAHPVIDAYRAFRPMPYDAPTWDVAAAFFAVHPDSEFFRLSEPGSVSVSEDGRMHFSPAPQGNVRNLVPDLSKKTEAVQKFIEIVSAKPVPPPVRTRRPAAAAAAAAVETPKKP